MEENLVRPEADELREQRKRLFEEYLKSIEAGKRRQEVEDVYEENDLMRQCTALEGESSFYKWWDDDVQMPPTGTRRQRIKLLKARLAVLMAPWRHGE
mgnify:CR=1 FL=1